MALYIESAARFGAAIKHLRLARGWSRAKLFAESGVSDIAPTARSLPAAAGSTAIRPSAPQPVGRAN